MTEQSRDNDFEALIAEGIERAEAQRARQEALLGEADEVEMLDEQDADGPIEPDSGDVLAPSGPAFEVDDATFAAAVRPYEPVQLPRAARAADAPPAAGWSLAQEAGDAPTVQMDVAELQAELDAVSRDRDGLEPVDAHEPADDPFAVVEAPATMSLPQGEPERPPAANPVLPPQDRPRVGGLAAAVSARAAARAERGQGQAPTPAGPARRDAGARGASAPVVASVAPPAPPAARRPQVPARPSASDTAREPPARIANPIASEVEGPPEPVVLTEPATDDPFALAAIERVRGWLAVPSAGKQDKSAKRLAALLKDPAGFAFAVGFVDRVVRPEDPKVGARNFEALSREMPGFLDWYLKLGITAGGGFGIVAPRMIIPVVKRAMREMVSHLVVDAAPSRLGRSLARLREDGAQLSVALLGGAVLGEEEATDRLERTTALIERDDVSSVSISIRSLVPHLQLWAFDETVERVVERLLPLYRLAAQSSPPKSIELDVEQHRDLDLTMAVFERLLTRPELARLEAGMVLQAYLPEALPAYRRLAAFARQRRADGGAGIKVRLVKGARLGMERVEAALHGWPLAVVPSKAAADAGFKRVLREALLPDSAFAVRLGVASHNLFDLAYAAELARHHGTHQRVDAEMLLGMASEHRDAVRSVFPNLVLYTPVVHPDRFDAAVGYLVRRLEEHASNSNFLSSAGGLDDPAVFQRERDRFVASLELLEREDAAGEPRAHRIQNRLGDLAVSVGQPEGFEHEPDTDPSIAPNRDWARQVVQRAAGSQLGLRTLQLNHIDDWPTLERRIDKAAQAGSGWAGSGAERRARILRDAATALGVYRGRLIEVMMAETGATFGEADAEVSTAIDFARWHAEQAILLESVEDATPKPVHLSVVAPPWSSPVAVACGGVTASLATGSAVILKPAPQARRSAAVMAEALWEAGVPRDVLVLCDVAEGEISKALMMHPAVGRVVLTGRPETAERFARWSSDLPLLAHTGGSNAIVVTPSADFELAVADIVQSAFQRAGQHCLAASVVILVDTVGDSDRFRQMLVDAASSLRVGSPLDVRAHVGPLVEPAQGALLRALTTLEEDEEWLLEPRQLDASGRLWSPGIRDAVLPGTASHVAELFGPHLSLIEVDTLDEAIEVQSGTASGLAAGLHSLDPEEVAHWLADVQAGNLFVNRPTTGAVVGRQPIGGWKRSQVGPGAKAGGPNQLATLVDWEPLHSPPKESVRLHGLDRRVQQVIEAATPSLEFIEFDAVRAGASSDQAWWEQEFGVTKDLAALGLERNLFRYRPTEVLIRVADDGRVVDLVRLLVAAARARAAVRISTSVEVPAGIVKLARQPIPHLRIDEIVDESDAAFHERLRSGQALAPVVTRDALGLEHETGPVRRIRLVGTDARLREALAGNVSVAVYGGPVTRAGRVELLPFLLEQSISITAHRFGIPDEEMLALSV